MFPPVIATVGGGGTRLYPLTLDQPKPLVDLCDTAIIATLFRVLANQGCRRFILGSKGAENTLPLNNYFKAGEGFFKRLGINDIEEFSYQPQYDDRGSADSLRYCTNYFDVQEDMLVVSGDNVIDINLRKFLDFHRDKGAVLTVALKELPAGEEVSQYGVADIDGDLRVEGFVEKPAPGREPSRMINTAFYLFSPEVRDVLAEMGDSARDIGGDLIPYLTERGYPVFGYPVKGYWIDIGTPERLLQAAMDFLAGKVEHYAFRNEYRPGQWVNPKTLRRIEKHLDSGDIELRGKVFIGRNCSIEKGVVIENSHIGHTSLIERDSKIKNSMVMSFSNIKRSSSLNRAIVGRHSTIGTKCVLDADLSSGRKPGRIPVAGENVSLPPESVVGPGTRVAPLKYSYKILATGKFSQLGSDDKNIFFCEK